MKGAHGVGRGNDPHGPELLSAEDEVAAAKNSRQPKISQEIQNKAMPTLKGNRAC